MTAPAPQPNEVELAKMEILECEKEISGIKAVLRALGPAAGSPGDDLTAASSSSTSEEEPNEFSVAWLKTEGLPTDAKPKLTLQLSSPIEEAVLTALYDPSSSSSSWSGMVTFRGVETGQATLVLTCSDADIPLGSSPVYEIANFAKMEDPMQPQPHLTELVVPLRVDSSESTPAEATDDDAVCTVTLQLTYRPSAKDQREELYELLSKVSRRKNAAVEQLRSLALAQSRQQLAVSSSSAAESSPAVKPGFLQGKKSAGSTAITSRSGAGSSPKPAGWRVWYQRYLGPQSLLRWVVPVAKNYVIFVGAVLFFHFRGQMLALPPPV